MQIEFGHRPFLQDVKLHFLLLCPDITITAQQRNRVAFPDNACDNLLKVGQPYLSTSHTT